MIKTVSAERVDYGARPVSVDIARGRPLTEAQRGNGPGTVMRARPLTRQVVADRLSLARWPYGHQVVVCSLAGGTGRSTVAGLIATVLAELPYAHLHRPVALVDTAPYRLTSTLRRWAVVDPCPDPPRFEPVGATPSGAWAFRDKSGPSKRDAFSVLVVDAPVGIPSELTQVAGGINASVVLVTRPDRVSLSDAADALVWMGRHSPVTRDRVNVVINNGVGGAARDARAAATALGIRCAAVHRLGQDPILAPGSVLPSGRAIPTPLRRTVNRLCLDICDTIPRPSRPTPKEQQ